MIRTAIVGMGIRGSLFARGLKQNPEATLVGVCDANQETMHAASQAWGVPGYAEFERLIEEQHPQAAIICTPDFAHRDFVLTAAEHGVHIMVEKPLATSRDEAREMVSTVQAAGVVCQVAFENRWNPPFVQIKHAVDKGELGDVALVNAKLNDTIFVPTKMLNWAARSTVGWFLLPHVVDLAIWLSGKQPNKVYAVANKKVLAARGVDTFDSICATISFHDDMLAVFETTWVLPESCPAVFDFKFEIVGDKGAMYVDAQDQMVHQATDRYTFPSTLVGDIHGQVRGFPLYMLDSFIESIQRGSAPLATIKEAYLVTHVIAAVHESIASGQPVVV